MYAAGPMKIPGKTITSEWNDGIQSIIVLSHEKMEFQSAPIMV